MILVYRPWSVLGVEGGHTMLLRDARTKSRATECLFIGPDICNTAQHYLPRENNYLLALFLEARTSDFCDWRCEMR